MLAAVFQFGLFSNFFQPTVLGDLNHQGFEQISPLMSTTPFCKRLPSMSICTYVSMFVSLCLSVPQYAVYFTAFLCLFMVPLLALEGTKVKGESHKNPTGFRLLVLQDVGNQPFCWGVGGTHSGAQRGGLHLSWPP